MRVNRLLAVTLLTVLTDSVRTWFSGTQRAIYNRTGFTMLTSYANILKIWDARLTRSSKALYHADTAIRLTLIQNALEDQKKHFERAVSAHNSSSRSRTSKDEELMQESISNGFTKALNEIDRRLKSLNDRDSKEDDEHSWYLFWFGPSPSASSINPYYYNPQYAGSGYSFGNGTNPYGARGIYSTDQTGFGEDDSYSRGYSTYGGYQHTGGPYNGYGGDGGYWRDGEYYSQYDEPQANPPDVADWGIDFDMPNFPRLPYLSSCPVPFFPPMPSLPSIPALPSFRDIFGSTSLPHQGSLNPLGDPERVVPDIRAASEAADYFVEAVGVAPDAASMAGEAIGAAATSVDAGSAIKMLSCCWEGCKLVGGLAFSS